MVYMWKPYLLNIALQQERELMCNCACLYGWGCNHSAIGAGAIAHKAYLLVISRSPIDIVLPHCPSPNEREFVTCKMHWQSLLSCCPFVINNKVFWTLEMVAWDCLLLFFFSCFHSYCAQANKINVNGGYLWSLKENLSSEKKNGGLPLLTSENTVCRPLSGFSTFRINVLEYMWIRNSAFLWLFWYAYLFQVIFSENTAVWERQIEFWWGF